MSLRDRIKRARSLITLGESEGQDNILTLFESLGNELQIRSPLSSAIVERGGSPIRHSAEIQRLIGPFWYTSLRLSDLLVRLAYVDLIRGKLAEVPESQRHEAIWYVYAPLAIKDFHTDVSSLMDSVAPLVLRINGSYKSRNPSYLPGFSDVQQGKRNDRKRGHIPLDILDVIDQTDLWWPPVKDIRDIVIHKEHHNLIFPQQGYGLLFQIYEDRFVPQILNSYLMYPEGHNVVDFSLYSGFVVANLLVFLEHLAEAIAQHLEIPIQSATPSFRVSNFKPLASSLDKLETLMA